MGVDGFSDEVIGSFWLLVAIGGETTESGDAEAMASVGVVGVDDWDAELDARIAEDLFGSTKR